MLPANNQQIPEDPHNLFALRLGKKGLGCVIFTAPGYQVTSRPHFPAGPTNFGSLSAGENPL